MKKLLLTATLLLSATPLTQASAVEPSVIGNNGERFSVIPVAADGNCAFIAIGQSRTEVVHALRNAVDDNYAAYERFNNSREVIHEAVSQLGINLLEDTSNSILDQVEAFVVSNADQYSSDPAAKTPATLAYAELVSFRSKLGSFSEVDFESAKHVLQNRIQNMYYERYESFQVALKKELQESGISEAKLDTKDNLEQSIDMFSRNSGKASWLPMGLILGVNERLGLDLTIWSSKGLAPSSVRLYQSSVSGNNVTDLPEHRQVVWNGSHFDILIAR